MRARTRRSEDKGHLFSSLFFHSVSKNDLLEHSFLFLPFHSLVLVVSQSLTMLPFRSLLMSLI